MIDVSCLGMRVVIARYVSHTDERGKIAKLNAPPVIEQKDPHLIGRIIHRHRRDYGALDDVQRFVVCGDQNIDSWPILGVAVEWERTPLQRSQSLKVPQNQCGEREELGNKKQQDKNGVPAMDVPGAGDS